MASRIAVVATFLAVVTIAFAFQGPALSQERIMGRDTFFEGLMGGGAEKGVVYVEIPLKKTSFAAA